MSGTLGQATFSLRVDVTNLVSGLNSAKSFVEQTTAQIDALLVGIGTGRAGAAAPFASLEAQLAQLNTQLASYTAEVARAGAATVSLAQPAQVAAAQFGELGVRVEATDAAVKAATTDWATLSGQLLAVEGVATTTGTALERVVAQWAALAPLTPGSSLAAGSIGGFAAVSEEFAAFATAETTARTELEALTVAVETWGTTTTEQAARATASMIEYSAASRTAAQGIVSGAGLSTRGGGLLSGLAGGADLADVAQFAAGLAAVTIAFQALRGAADFAKSSMIDFNAELQADAIRLQNLVGGATEAGRVLGQLAQESGGSQFGGFAFSDLEKGTEILARFGVANQTVERQVADTAAGTGQSYAAVAQQIGRLYDLLDNGQPIGRVAVQLERSGILTADWVSKLEAAQKAGADQATLDALLTEGLSKYNGQAAQLGDTWGATTSEITNGLKLMAAEAGKPIFDGLLASLHQARDDLQLFDQAAANHRGIDAMGLVLDQLGVKLFSIIAGFDQLLNKVGLVSDQDLQYQQKQLQQFQDEINKQVAGQAGPALPGGGGTDQYSEAGQQAGKAFAQGFTAASLEQLAQGVVRFGEGVDPVFQSIVAGLEQANPLLDQLIADYQQLATDQVAVQATTLAVADAQQHLKDVTKQANDELQGLQQAIKDDQALAQQHANAYQGTIDGLNAQLKGIQDQAKTADEAWTTTIDNLRQQEQALQRAASDRKQAWQDTITAAQDDLTALQDTATAHQQAFQAQLDSLRQQQQTLADAASQHAGVYKAILDGTIDTYVQLTGKEDDLTRAVRARWQEEVAGQLRAKTGADAAVRAKQEEQDKSTLALDTQIADARRRGDQRELAALETRKKQIDAGYANELQLLNDRAKVANDQFTDTQKQVQGEAQQQAAKDQAAQNGVKQQIQGVQDAQKAQKAADDDAIKAQQERIKGLQDQAIQQDHVDQAAIKGVQDQIQNDQDLKTKQDARFKGEEDGITKQIGLVQQQQTAQGLMDKAKEGADQQHYNDRKAYWDQEETNAKNSVAYAQQAEQAAKDQLTYDTQHLTNLKEQAQWEDYINTLVAARGKLGAGPSNLPALAPTEGPRAGQGQPLPPSYVTPPAPGQQGYVAPFSVGAPASAPGRVGPTSGREPALTAADYRPAATAPGVVNQTNTFNVSGTDAHALTDQLGAHVFDATQAALEQAARGGYNLARVRA